MLAKRASPKQWSKYATSSLVLNILRNKKTLIRYDQLQETLYTERRDPGRGRFYDNPKGKVGKQKLRNNLLFLAAIQEDWYGLDGQTDDRIQTLLKYTYFNYLTNG